MCAERLINIKNTRRMFLMVTEIRWNSSPKNSMVLKPFSEKFVVYKHFDGSIRQFSKNPMVYIV